MEVAISIVILLIGFAIAITVQRFLSRPKDEQWLQDLLSDVHTLKDTPPMTIEISQTDLDLLNAGKPVALQGPAIIVPPTPVASIVYGSGKFFWAGDWSFNGKANYADGSFAVTGQWGGWLPYANGLSFNTEPYPFLVVKLKPTIANQKWSAYCVAAGDTTDGHAVDVLKYGPAPVVGVWGTYKIALADMALTNKQILKFAIQDQTGLGKNLWYFDTVGFAAA